jgi:hypothetical protein
LQSKNTTSPSPRRKTEQERERGGERERKKEQKIKKWHKALCKKKPRREEFVVFA